jgi:CO dehydrogenase/acetyl-CoA synthase gamma subunit (corrinoid Fe-S protein)
MGPAQLAQGDMVLTLFTVCDLHRNDVESYLLTFSTDAMSVEIEALPDILQALDEAYMDTGETYWMAASA